MCGFAGLFLHDRSAVPQRERIEAMAVELSKRGPDEQRIELGPGFGLGFRRLAIIDLAGGHQPFTAEGGGIVAVVNGEIYNWRALRAELEAAGRHFTTDSDCEVIPHLYAIYGAGFAERLVGMYAFALVDQRGPTSKLLLGRDRLGIKPLYWAEIPGGLAFASEPKALVAPGVVPAEVHPEGLLDYLVQGYSGGPRSLWDPIRRLAPAGILELAAGGSPQLDTYWDLPGERHTPSAEPGEVLEFLDRVVREHMLADVPLGAFLSGGIDSSAVVDSMARQSGEPVVACSIGFAERTHDELDLARQTAQRLGLVHHTRVLTPDPTGAAGALAELWCEPLADPSCLPTYQVCKVAREHVTVALSGDGGDETFAGYRRYVHDLAENRLRARLGGALTRAAGALGSIYPHLAWAPRFLRGRTFLTNLGSDPARAYFRSVSQMERAEALDLLHPDLAHRIGAHDPFEAFAEHYRRPALGDPLYRAQYADFHTYLPDQILAKADRASMGVSLEVRVPLLDHRFVERFAPMPSASKVRGGRGKVAFREALRSRLPSDILDGRKRGFDTPLKTWISGPLRGGVEEALASLPADWFRRDALQQRLAEHLAGARDHGRLLWSLLVLEHWRRRWKARGLAA